ncbi:Organic cation transporter protein [Nymphon striatum]|nr:Organic cation transporter protein [Nymphon striatum]
MKHHSPFRDRQPGNMNIWRPLLIMLIISNCSRMTKWHHLWNLVCDKSVLVTVISSVYMAGMMFGLLIIPQFSDRFGRKPVILIVLLVCFVSTLGLTFSPNIIIFSVLRFVIAATDIPGTSMIFIMGQECLSERNRALWGNLSNVSFPIGTLFLTMFSYLTTNWRITQVIAIVPLIIMFILHLKTRPLPAVRVATIAGHVMLSTNRSTVMATSIPIMSIQTRKKLIDFKSILDRNYRDIRKIRQKTNKRNKKTKVTLLDLFKTPEVRIRTLITYLLWFTVAFCYYAFTLNLQDIAGNLFLNMTIASILECGGVFLSSLLLIKVGRRLPTSFLMLFSGLTILLSIAVPTRLIWLKVGLSLLGKTSISMVFAIIYLHTTEYMPTVARSIGLGSSSLFARIGAIISPYVHIIKEVTSQSVVFAIYGVMCILCGLAVLRLPETRNQPLQEFIEDAENYDYKSKRKMDNYLNELVKKTGWWQILMLMSMTLIAFFCGIQNVAMPFYAPLVDHWCAKPNHLKELPTKQWKNYSLPSEETKGGKITYSSCKQFDIDYTNISVADYVSFMDNFKSGNRTVSEKSCSSWTYDKSIWKETIVSDWNLVCDKSVLVSVTSSVYMAGMACGVFIIPQFSDRFGRKPVILIVLLVCFVSTLSLTFSPNIIIFTVLRFLIAATDIPGASMIYVIGQECLSERNRALWGNITSVGFSVGTLVLTMFSYLTKSWRITPLISIVPLIMMFILHLKIPESLRWQLSMGKYDKALKTMKVCSGMNRYTLPSEDILQQEIENIKKEKTIEEKDKRNKKTKVTLLDLFKTPEVRIRTLITYLLWFTVSFCYYAFTLNLQDIAGNLFLNMTIAAILESFGGISSSLLMLKFGRRLPTSFLMFFSGVTILLSIAVPTRLTWLKVGLSLIGRTSISMVFAIMFLHTTEYMPTVARSIGLGSSSLFARFGAIISPYVHELKEVSSESVVFAIYGVMCILCGLSTLRLPETRNQPLQEFIEDAENYDYKSKRTYEYPPHVISVHVLSEGRRSFPSGLICVRNPKEKHDTKQREVGVLNIKSNLGESDPTYVEEVYES